MLLIAKADEWKTLNLVWWRSSEVYDEKDQRTKT
jgi:hypothetical protein